MSVVRSELQECDQIRGPRDLEDIIDMSVEGRGGRQVSWEVGKLELFQRREDCAGDGGGGSASRHDRVGDAVADR